MTMNDTDRAQTLAGVAAPLDRELLEDELADLLAGSIEIKQLLWNLGPQARLGLDKLLAELAQDSSHWADQIAQRLWDLGAVPSAACVRPLLRPDPTGARRLDERATGMRAAHLTARLAERTRLRAEQGRMIDAQSRKLLHAIERELVLYARLARRPDRLTH